MSSGEDLLAGESGTVRHLNWPIPACVSTGQYNVSTVGPTWSSSITWFHQLTFYESSHIDDGAFFTITSIPISVVNNNGNSGEPCPFLLNDLGAQPQASAPSSKSPFLPDNQFLFSATPSQSTSSSGMYTSVTTNPTPTITITLTAGGQFPSDYMSFFTQTPSPTTETIVLVSVVTKTTTVTGEPDPMTTV